jgi:lipid-A-disaccharide synthase
MRYYIIAGERSGDLHASNLIKEIKKEDSNAQVRGIGGELLLAQGTELLFNYQQISFMGFLEVFSNLSQIKKAMKACKEDIITYKPDVLILVDFAGFNLRIAKFAKENNLKVYYYISPKIWAWNQSRAYKIKALIDRMFVILPFEKDFYKKFDYEVDYVGNPLYDAIASFNKNESFKVENRLSEKPIIAILPGSRKQEVESMLHYMVSIIPSFKEYQFIIAAVSNLPKSFYEPFQKQGIHIVYDQTYDLLLNAHVAVVTSGTATLETALFEVPQVVCYRTSGITYSIAKLLIKVKFISLVNLIAGEEIVKELIQKEFVPANLVKELKRIVENSESRTRQLEGYKKIKSILGSRGASEKTAKLMIQYLKEK